MAAAAYRSCCRPGLGGGAGYWAPNIAALADGRRVIAYDHRGTGRSDPEVPGVLTVEAMAADVVALLDALGGSSGSGWSAMRLAG